MKRNLEIIRSGMQSRHVQIFIGHFIAHAREPLWPPISRGKDWNRWHLFYTVQGKGFIECSGQLISLLPPIAFLVTPGTEYTFGTDPKQKMWNQYSMEFLPRAYWYDWLDWPEIVPGVMSLQVPDDAHQRVTKALNMACEFATMSHWQWEDFAMAAAEMVLLEFRELNKELQQKHHADPRLQQAIEFMEQNHSNPKPVTREDVARAAMISPPYLNALFQKHMGTSPMHYLDTLRINRAQRLLRETNEPIAQVGRLCGFSNPIHFCNRFRKLTGHTPSGYRKKLR